MAEEAPKVASARFRRANQDYSSCNVFLPLHVWRNLSQAKSDRAKAEELAEFLFQQLELRLPTEPTYATMTALITCNGTPSRFELHSALQTVKAAWRGISQRLQKILKEDKKAQLLSALPKTWEELPEHIRLKWGDVRPAGCQESPMSESYGWCCLCNESAASTGGGFTGISETHGGSSSSPSTEESWTGGKHAEEFENLCFSQEQELQH